MGSAQCGCQGFYVRSERGLCLLQPLEHWLLRSVGAMDILLIFYWKRSIPQDTKHINMSCKILEHGLGDGNKQSVELLKIVLLCRKMLLVLDRSKWLRPQNRKHALIGIIISDFHSNRK